MLKRSLTLAVLVSVAILLSGCSLVSETTTADERELEVQLRGVWLYGEQRKSEEGIELEYHLLGFGILQPPPLAGKNVDVLIRPETYLRHRSLFAVGRTYRFRASPEKTLQETLVYEDLLDFRRE